jgi:hypothetical protein
MFPAVSTHPVFTQRLKIALLAGFLALSVMVGAATTATRVGAEPVQRGLDGFSNACADLQDQAGSLVSQYGATAGANPNDPRLDDILSQLRSIGTTWQQIGCQGVYGNILRVVPAGTSSLPITSVYGNLQPQAPANTVSLPVAPVSGRFAGR